MVSLGVVTIGQTPRDDLTPDLHYCLPGVSLIERGGLDGLTLPEIRALKPRDGEEQIESRLANGSSATIGAGLINARLQEAIDSLQGQVDAILLARTGPFSPFTSSVPIIEPGLALSHTAAALSAQTGRLAIICPLPSQIEEPGTNP